MSTFTYPKPGIGNANSYLTSGIPFATASVEAPVLSSGEPATVSFPHVTKFITIKNTSTIDHSIRIGFSKNGILNGNYFLLAKDESFSGDLRIVDLFIINDGEDSGDTVSVVAGLTTIDRIELPTNWSGSAGVG